MSCEVALRGYVAVTNFAVTHCSIREGELTFNALRVRHFEGRFTLTINHYLIRVYTYVLQILFFC